MFLSHSAERNRQLFPGDGREAQRRKCPRLGFEEKEYHMLRLASFPASWSGLPAPSRDDPRKILVCKLPLYIARRGKVSLGLIFEML